MIEQLLRIPKENLSRKLSIRKFKKSYGFIESHRNTEVELDDEVNVDL